MIGAQETELPAGSARVAMRDAPLPLAQPGHHLADDLPHWRGVLDEQVVLAQSWTGAEQTPGHPSVTKLECIDSDCDALEFADEVREHGCARAWHCS